MASTRLTHLTRRERPADARIRMTRALLAGWLALGLAAPAARAQAPPNHEELEQHIIEIAQQVIPSVVYIEAIVRVNDRRNQVTGSGVILSEDGLVITNQHVVEKAEKVEVVVPGRKRKHRAQILGTDKQTDISLLRITPDSPLPAARYGSADGLKVGQWVLAVGNPYGLDGTVSLGIVSAKGRNLEIPDLLNDFIQTDAMIDRGSSGGPLVDLEGRVVGINSRGQGRGIGFTIPIDTALEVVREIQQGGIERGWLGVSLQPLDRDLTAYFGLGDATGVIVNSVSGKSPAERAGLRPGDVITHFAGHPVEAEKDEDIGSFQRLVAGSDPGEKVELAILRDGKPRTLEVEIGTQPKVEPEEEETEVGFHVQEITENLFRAERLASRRGAYISFVERGSPASEAGLLPGDVVERIEKQPVENLADFRSAMAQAEGRASFLITARRGEETKFILVKRGARPATAEEQQDEAGEPVHGPATEAD
jgi:serine protease Do